MIAQDKFNYQEKKSRLLKIPLIKFKGEPKMKIKQTTTFLLIISLLMFFLPNVRAQKKNRLTLSSEDVVLQWNRVLTETIRTPGAHPSATIFPVRSYAMMHAAMFDAVNSIDGTYTPYLTDVPGSKNASIEAAAGNDEREIRRRF